MWMNTAAVRGALGPDHFGPTLPRGPAIKQGTWGDTKLTPTYRTVQLGKLAHMAVLIGFVLGTLGLCSDPGCVGGAPDHSNKERRSTMLAFSSTVGSMVQRGREHGG